MIKYLNRGASKNNMIRSYEGDSVDDWMAHTVYTLSRNKTAYTAACEMKEKRIGSLVILQNNLIKKTKANIVGIVTETDIVRKVVALDKSPEKIKLGAIMTEKPYVLESSASILQASHLITQERIKRIPVTKQGLLAGIFTVTDLVRALVKLGKLYEVGELVKYIAKKKMGTKQFVNIMRASQWMSKDVITCRKETSLHDIARMMENYQVGDVVVMQGDTIAGVITDTDVVRRMCAEKKSPEKTFANELMSSPAITLSAENTLLDAATMMNEKKIKRVVITDKDKLVGLFSVTDLADALIQLNNFSQAHKIIDMLYG